MRLRRSIPFVLAASVLFSGRAGAQEDARRWRLGVAEGVGTQQAFPFNKPLYKHDFWAFKILLNRALGSKGAFSWEVQLEPSVYVVRHRLLNPYYVQPSWGADYLAQRVRYARGVQITEYVLNAGLVGRYSPTRRMSLFLLVSTGPMYSDAATERLAKGLAFSDILACGVGYRLGGLLLELRPGLRHVSNAHTQDPNGGYNTVTIDLAVWSSP